jgi:rod shape-determining protein MreD
MPVSTHRSVAVFTVHPAVLAVGILAALLLQIVLPLKFPLARLMDFPLLVVIYFALMRREKVYGTMLGTGVGVLQDALSHGYIGIFGICNSVVGYLAASASTRFELESLLARTVLTGVFVLVHDLCLAGLQRLLLETPPPFQPLTMASAVLVNAALGLLVFQVFDRFRRPA